MECTPKQSSYLGAASECLLARDGAGWDTRPYGPLPEGADVGGSGVKIFEVDEPPTQEAKVRALKAAGVEYSHVTLAPTDFNQQTWLESLTEHGFDPDLPTFILWEGVTMYLDDAAVDKTLAEVAGFAPGSRITFDFFSRELVFGRKPYAVIGNYMKYALKSFYGESMHFGISTAAPARQQALDFFEGRGLEVRELRGVRRGVRARDAVRRVDCGRRCGRGQPRGSRLWQWRLHRAAWIGCG